MVVNKNLKTPEGNEIDLVHTTDVELAKKLTTEGYEPIECAFGRESVVGPLLMDHHGQFSTLPAVSIRAAAIALNHEIAVRKFVVTGISDLDQIYAIGVLSGNIKPSFLEASIIAQLDIDPVGIDKSDDPLRHYIKPLIFEQKTSNLEQSTAGARKALEIAIEIYSGRALTQSATDHAYIQESDRRNRVKRYITDSEKGLVALAVSPEKGFNEWYEIAPVVVQYNPQMGNITVGLCTKTGGKLTSRTGFDVLGTNGLTPLYACFGKVIGGKEGWGGRDVIGGSPRGMKMTEQDAKEVYNFLIKETKRFEEEQHQDLRREI